jgi:hypothetical protein
MDVFVDEQAHALDDYRILQGFGCRPDAGTLKAVDKGHRAELEAFHRAVMGIDRFPIPRDELEETWRLTWEAGR